MEDGPALRDPPRVVAAAFGLAAICLLLPIAIVGGVLAGLVLIRRNRPAEGAAVLVLSVVCTAFGIALLR